ncbi:hypothetical protein AAG570_001478 [Ranatra chinensis]|uniref:Pyridine nucleotide-disulfide oxidoreductase domain-containing protein 1 n=1 Tax=Ranatra chinensis TaxID=642074 RepID=A0ABD0Y8M8_9HEMI
MEEEAVYVIVGGGIGGVSCAEALSIITPDESVILVTASPTVKAVTNVVPLTKMAAKFDVEERSVQEMSGSIPSLKVIEDRIVRLDPERCSVHTESGKIVRYKKLCLATGASPRLIGGACTFVIGIRDTDSVENFRKRIEQSRRVMVVGNGGIATEIVHEVRGVDIVWAIKDNHISATFIDPGAAQFFQSALKKEGATEEKTYVKRLRYKTTGDSGSGGGAALGPDWHSKVNLHGPLEDSGITVEYCCEVLEIRETPGKEWPVEVELTNKKVYGVDFIISATGVVPNVEIPGAKFEKMDDGGIKVDWKLETSIGGIFAAGDACSAGWDLAAHWFQMRLWTQARHMGAYVARAMFHTLHGEELYQDFAFEMFTHVTKFFGMKVVLLGLFNGQRLDNDYELMVRVTRGVEYVKLVIKDGRLQGAVLIGETDLEEMCENLILNQLDLTDFGEDLLNPDIDIEDYFD